VQKKIMLTSLHCPVLVDAIGALVFHLSVDALL
jgi:hypothetical protein